MRIIADTNVVVSGIFFSGPPFEILKAFRNGRVHFVLSPEILDEYYAVVKSLETKYDVAGAETIVTLIATNSEIVQVPELTLHVCDDPDDDKFLACAQQSKVELIVSGDKHLLKQSGYRGIAVVSPRVFLEQRLKER